MSDDDNVKRLPIRFKAPPAEGRTLFRAEEIERRQCRHYPGHFIVDESRDTVGCADCGERLNPMWVLKQLTARDSNFHHAHDRYEDEMARLAERSRTACEHCGKMTRISRR